MEEEFMIVNLGAKLVLLIRFVVTTVEKSAAIFFPRRIRELDPIQQILSILAGLDIAHFPLLPIGPAGSETISHQPGVLSHIKSAQRDRPILRQQIWVEQFARRLGKIGRGIEHILILQTGVLRKEIMAVFFEWHAEPLVIPYFG